MSNQNGEIRALRRVIANAIERSDDEPYGENDDVYLLNADAVITALGLKRVGWMGPYGIVPGGLDVEPHANWRPLYMLNPADLSGSTEEAPDGR